MQKRIGILIPTLNPGGAEKVALTLANGFTARGFQADMIVKDGKGSLRCSLDKRVNVIDTQAGRSFGLLRPLTDYLRRQQPDFLISHLELTNVLAILARRLAASRAKLICVTHSNIAMQESVLGHKALERSVLRWLYAGDIERVVVSKAAAAEYAAYTSVPLDDVNVIYNPVIDAGFHERAAQPVNHPWLTEKALPVFLFVGRLDPVKRVPDIVRALALVNQTRPARLLVAGEGPARQAILDQAAELGMSDQVALLGHVDNPLPLMRAADALVLASEREGFSIVLVEAMACGTPVVSTDCPHGPAELLDAGRYGHLVPVGDAAAMSRAMLSVLAGDARPAPQDWLAQFTLDRALNSYVALL